MKKMMLLSGYAPELFGVLFLSILFGFSGFGQINYSQDFNGCDAATCSGWTIASGWQPSITATTGNGYSPCANSSAKSNIYVSSTTTTLTSNVSLGTSSGFNATFNFDYKCIDYSTGAATPANSCTFTVAWSPNGTTWNTVGSFQNSASASCVTSPDFNFSPPLGSAIRMRITATRDAGDFWAVIDNIGLVQSAAATPTLHNLSADPTISTSFAHRRGASIRPKFTISGSSDFDAVQIELNEQSDFSGTALVSTIDDGTTYTASTPYDFWTTDDLTSNRTYFVRARLSSDGGTTWGSWSTQFWPYSYYPATVYEEEGWYFTTEEQFQLGTVDESLYNYLSIQDNGTAYPDDDFFQVNQGSFNVNAGIGDGVRESGTWYSTQTYMTIGWQNNCNGNAAIHNGMPFQLNIPQAALINSADFSLVSTTDCPCEVQTVPLRLIVDAHNVDNGPALTGSNVLSLVTPPRTTANQTFLYNATWVNNTRYSITPVTNIMQEVINRPGWNAGNMFNLLIRWNAAFSPGSNNNRCVRQANSTANAPRIVGTFTNFYNTVRFPSVDRAIYGPNATAWDELRVTDDTQGCGTCYVEYRIHDAGTNAVLAGPFLRPAGMSGAQYFDISAVGATDIYVSTRVFRNNSPVVHDIWLTTTDVSPLPVEWGALNGTCSSKGNEITWSTVTEMNNAYFTVERSTDGEEWKAVCQQTGAGTATKMNSYSCIDTDARGNVNYYRVRQTDYDGQTKVSDVFSVVCDQIAELNVYPNPTQGVFLLEGGQKGMTAILLDPTGREVMHREITDHVTHFDINNLTKGVYVIKVVDKEKSKSFKIVLN